MKSLTHFSPTTFEANGLRRASVAIVVHRRGGDLGIWVIRRAAGMREHPGQYALPGGRVEPGEDVIAAGLRELDEELGVGLTRDDVVGRLDDYVTRSGYVISSIICWAPGRRSVTINTAEVASVQFVSFIDLLASPRFVPDPESGRCAIEFPLFDVLIQAPTAALLFQFAEVVLRGRQTRVASFE